MTLTEFEASLVGAPSWQRLGAGAAIALRDRLNRGEAWSAPLLTAVSDTHRQPLRDSGMEQTFRALTGV